MLIFLYLSLYADNRIDRRRDAGDRAWHNCGQNTHGRPQLSPEPLSARYSVPQFPYVELGLLLQGGKKWVQNHVYWLQTALITSNTLNQLCKNINHNLRVLKDNCNLHNWNILLLQLILEVPFTCSTGGWPPGNLCTVLLTTLGQCHAYSLMSRPTKWQSRNDWMFSSHSSRSELWPWASQFLYLDKH